MGVFTQVASKSAYASCVNGASKVFKTRVQFCPLSQNCSFLATAEAICQHSPHMVNPSSSSTNISAVISWSRFSSITSPAAFPSSSCCSLLLIAALYPIKVERYSASSSSVMCSPAKMLKVFRWINTWWTNFCHIFIAPNAQHNQLLIP